MLPETGLYYECDCFLIFALRSRRMFDAISVNVILLASIECNIEQTTACRGDVFEIPAC